MARPLPKCSITTPLLKKYFSVVKDLRTYLSEILEPLAQTDTNPSGTRFGFEPNDSDSSLYCSLLSTSYVAFKVVEGGGTPKHYFKNFPVVVDMREVLDKAQERIFRSKNSQNIITAGYRRAFRDGDRGRLGMTRVGIANYFVNTIITAFQGPEWETLLQRIGVDAMLHLLSETYMFISLPNDCLCQITGEPIIYTAPMKDQITKHVRTKLINTPQVGVKRSFPFPEDDGESRPTKRRKSPTTILNPTLSVTTSPPKRLPADISFARTRLFYARPSLVPQTNRLIIGLPEKHILNRIVPSYLPRPKINPNDFVDPNPRLKEDHARHLAKYIFPRQYGLLNPFIGENSYRSAFELPDYLDRELEIKAKGSCKTPKRLKPVLALLETMIWRHGKCGYKPLRDKACPSKLGGTDDKDLDSTIILELMSEQSSMLYTQAPADITINSSFTIPAPTQTEYHTKSKPRFAEFACPPVEVFRYIALVTKVVIPKAFWGSDNNLKTVLRYVKEFIQCRRFETLSLHHVIQGFRIGECDWLICPGPIAVQQGRISVSDALKRRELSEDFLFWYFDSFVSYLLKTNFYITESSAFRNRTLYFRHDDWETLCSPLIERLTAGTFVKISDVEAKEVVCQRRLGFSFVRLLPKETGVRAIVNLRRRKPIQRGSYSSEKSINQILQAAFQILTYEKNKDPQRLGASVFSPDDVYTKLKDFKSRLPRNPDKTLPRLYFVKVDVQACFDTIEQTKLLEILRELISEDVYMTQRYGQVRMATGRIKRIYTKRAVPEDEHPHFLKYATELAGVLRHTIFVDQVIYPYSQKHDILHLLEEHITENIVKIGSHFYRQTIGIPQGSILSTLLCSFFYGDLEKRFTNFKDDPHSVLLRLVDDYLFITTDHARAKEFLDIMNKGHPEYGCFISKEKTFTNFDYDAQILNVTEPKQLGFPWCGYVINMKDLSVSVDYSRYNGTHLRDTLTIDRGRRPGAAFIHAMLWLARAKSHPIYSDLELNTKDVVYLNIYQNFLLCAMKMHSYIHNWRPGANKNTTYIHVTIQKVINFAYSNLRDRHLYSSSLQIPLGVQKAAVTWLGVHAFYTVLNRKPAHYTSVLRTLRSELSKPCSKRYKKRFGSLTKEGQTAFLQISF